MVRAASTGSVNIMLAVLLEESVTLAVKVTGLAAGGVPLRAPAALNVSQLGRPVADQIYPPVPPDAVNVLEYSTPMVAGLSGEVLLIVRTLFTGSVNICIVVLDAESLTVTVNVTGPALGGVPLSPPLLARFSQEGRPVALNV